MAWVVQNWSAAAPWRCAAASSASTWAGQPRARSGGDEAGEHVAHAGGGHGGLPLVLIHQAPCGLATMLPQPLSTTQRAQGWRAMAMAAAMRSRWTSGVLQQSRRAASAGWG